MNIKSLFKKYIVPHEINIVDMLQEQSSATHKMIEDLYACFIKENESGCEAIRADQHQTELLKEKNMNQLLNAFITPIDRESIYRAITQLDEISISVKHFVMETKAYKIHELSEYKEIFHLIYKASKKLKSGFEALDNDNHAELSRLSQKVRQLTDEISEEYIHQMVKLSSEKDSQIMFKYKEILSQLKDIAAKIHTAANTLQDIIVKMD